MPRTAITAETTPGSFPVLPVAADSLDLTATAADVGNGNDTTLVNGKTIVLAYNTDAGAQTITFTSIADSRNRTGDITAYSLGIGEMALFGPFVTAGWEQAGNKLYIDASDANVEIFVITLP